MTNERERPLAAISDEINRALDHLDAKAAERAAVVDAHFNSIEAGMRDVKSDLIEVTVQVKATNGRVKDLEMWRRYWEGVRAGAGTSWQVLIAGVGVVIGVGGVVVAIVSLN
jgi:hypothetical protein